ncbi:MAG: ElyC/SanA/YdcF family protein, partial [Nanoarchaeota archaeon]
ILEEESLETYGNMENTKALLDKYNLANGKLALVTVGLHLPRSVKICDFYELEVDVCPSEEQVKQISEHHKAAVERYEKSCFVKREKLREFLLRRIQLINPSGNIPRILGEYMRK